MLKVGITGGIGSGKTTVCRVFESLGIPVFYADQVAKSLMTTDPLLVAGVKQAFGEASYLPAGALNNRHIADIVFNHTEELEKLNALVHPAVFRAFDRWVAGIAPDVPYVLKEAALLFESGSYRMCDVNILVTCPMPLRLARVMSRDGLSEAQVLARMDKQFSDAQKQGLADHVIENNEQSSLILQVLGLHRRFSGTSRSA